jgi:hypothetical protein
MPNKYLGPGTSGYDIPDGRAWETVGFKAGVPILDRELVLVQDIDGGAAQAVLKRSTPSGWLSDDYVTTTDPVGAIFAPIVVADSVEIPNDIIAHVNGWLVKVRHTNATGSNQLDLGTSPAGLGAQRTDIVFLEVWRKLLSASPSTDGKSATARIWQEGNVKTDPANDLVLNYPDDILDINVGAETTKRVQIQYRLRSIQSIDLFAFPYALDDPTVLARSVPPNAATPDGNPTVFPYVNQSANGDPGLWIAGDGNPANTLGTVDGYMYAVPLFGVFRRNSTAFDRRLNHNGGVASPGPSDRPDGLFYDMIVAEDLVDLRLGINPIGWSLSELLEKNTNFLFDNTLRTEIGDTSPFGGGYRGTTVFLDNEIGITNANGGDGVVTGSTGSGPLINQFDAICRRFSDRSIFETVTVVVNAPMGGWLIGSVVTINPSSLEVFPYAPFNWSAYAPADVLFMDILRVQWVGATPPSITADAIVNITGLGASPITSLSITIKAFPFGPPTNEPLHVTIVVGYPNGVGLSHTPIADFGASSFSVNNPGQLLPPAPPVWFNAFASQALDYPHREVNLEYETVSLTYNVAADTTPFSGPTVYLPERAQTVTLVTVNAVPVGWALDTSGKVLTLAPPPVPGDAIVVTYTARRPMPQNNEQITIYFRTAVPQTARNALLSGILRVIPKLTDKKMYALTTGSGSQDEGYPFTAAYVQSGGVYVGPPYVYSGESELAGRAEISVADFDAQTGFLSLPVYVPMVASPESLIFTRGLGDIDVEGRTYFKTVPAGYVPNAYAQDLSNPDRHKDVFPMLAELADDSPLGHRGQLVLVLLIRYAIFDSTNGVYFDAVLANNSTTASVFRIKGNLLNKRQQ